jgi:single-strand DNA-binding protein
MYMNKVIVVGYLGQDPELRTTSSGKAVCNMTLATTDKWYKKDGTAEESTEWHRIVVWGRQAENCAKYLTKGSLAMVEGSLQTREWEDKNGTKQKTTEIRAQKVSFGRS